MSPTISVRTGMYPIRETVQIQMNTIHMNFKETPFLEDSFQRPSFERRC